MKTYLLALIMLSISVSVWASPPGSASRGQASFMVAQADRSERADRHNAVTRGNLLPALTDSQTESIIGIVLEEVFGIPTSTTQSNGKQKSLPPGLQKKLARGGELPPGWQKKVARGEVLDGHLYRQSQVLSPDILRRVDGRHQEAELIVLGDRILRVMKGEGTVLDVINIAGRVLDIQ
ncbi:hypothetical protein [Nitrincola sp. MINF-07-Sa-05]|uniref:hypothetical protein n=1 Tax=Nitrincola salilacus TaxID=3400273 RepID=UPI003917BFBB